MYIRKVIPKQIIYPDPYIPEGLNRGAWTAWEDEILINFVKVHGEGKWRDLPQRAGA